MRIVWDISDQDCAELRGLVEKQSRNAFVQGRADRNLTAEKMPITKDVFWKAVVSMRLTSQQRSGPNSPVGKFIRRSPFPLNYEAVVAESSPELFIESVLQSAGGIRFHEKIATELTCNLRRLEGEGGEASSWEKILAECERLLTPGSRDTERKVADCIDQAFVGIGPKQARNILQYLGLTRFEIPLDSRIVHWLKNFGFPVPVSARLLANHEYYCFVLDAIQELCRKAGVLPTIFDAAVFAIQDGTEWTAENFTN